MPFRTIQISNPRFEPENLRFITVKSQNLKARGDIVLFLPPGPVHREIPLIILLHGVYGSAWCWAMNAGIHQIAMSLIKNDTIQPVAIAMPSDGLWGDGSGYLPHDHQNFEKWIIEDVPAAVTEAAKITLSDRKLFLSGLSMGGFGAIRMGIKYQQHFAGVSGHSSITSVEQLSLFVEESIDLYRQPDQSENSIWGTIESMDRLVPPLRFDCGTQDPLIEFNRKLHQQLQDANIRHEYQEFPGGHDWGYWEQHVVKTLLFFNDLM
jgi:enterochelin esterase-like enzyme